jgi:predicted MPP superfamily phosphohydrolase
VGLAVLLALAAAGGLIALMVAQAYSPSLVRRKVVCPRLPAEFQGFRVLQLSDLHMMHLGRRERAIRRLVRDLKPDVVALTGDLAQDEAAARELAGLVRSAGASEGAFAISGNADVRFPLVWEGVKRVLREGGIAVLENEHRLLRRGKALMVLAGVEDPHTGLDDLRSALAGAPGDAFILLLAHSPSIIVAAVEAGCDLVLSGHTHGGQIVLPGYGPLLTRSGYGKRLSSGLFGGERLRRIIDMDPGRTQVYISRGIGSSFLPLRLLCRPEVTLFELTRE